jgi:hypothetical protein
VNNTGQEIVKHKVQRAVDINPLHKIGLIVATEQQTHVDRAQTVELFARCGWIALQGAALLMAYCIGSI